MNANDFVALIHLVGFVTGVALYGMLAVMTWRGTRGDTPASGHAAGSILVLAALLGLIWNAGALLVFGWHDFGLGELSPWLTTLSYGALGFLPAVVVDSATRVPRQGARPSNIALAAYVLSATGAVMQVTATAHSATVSTSGFLTLTLGYAAILLALAVTSRRRTGSQRALTAVALAAFAVSALHLSRHSGASDSWVAALLGHHASLPLVLVILYQDYRFALADLFLKRAIAAIALVAIVLTEYALLARFVGNPAEAGRATGVLLAAWISTALLYPHLRVMVDRLVDRVILGRSDYRDLRAEIAAMLAEAETPDEALETTAGVLRDALTAGRASWHPISIEREGELTAAHAGMLVVLDGTTAATLTIPTTDAPRYEMTLGVFANGRRMLSDDVTFLDGVALLVARRIDELRVARERLERDVREHEMQRLAAEAELRALRAQLNPHFLFNALTTIGYLIRTSPKRAVETLMQLTALLRSVLRGADGEFVTLGEELRIIDAYLAIEQARFESRLQIERDVPRDLEALMIPPLVLQPLVENAIKHAVAPRRRGARVRVEAFLERTVGPAAEPMLHLRVSDSGPGVTNAELDERRKSGVGLANIEQRLDKYFGARARLEIRSERGRGTVADVVVPVVVGEAAVAV